jgi:hypothetical protein
MWKGINLNIMAFEILGDPIKQKRNHVKEQLRQQMENAPLFDTDVSLTFLFWNEIDSELSKAQQLAFLKERRGAPIHDIEWNKAQLCSVFIDAMGGTVLAHKGLIKKTTSAIDYSFYPVTEIIVSRVRRQ